MSRLHANHPLVKIRGQVMIISIIFLAVVLILASSLFANVTQFVNFGSRSILREQTNSLAEAGIERALWQLNQTAGAYTGEANTSLGEGTFTVSIQNKNVNLKTITATGYIPNSSNPKAKRTIKLDAVIDNTIIAFSYAVQTNLGGLVMKSNAEINGNTYTNGSITGESNSEISGNASAVGTISNPPTVFGIRSPGAPFKDMPTFDAQYWKDKANINNNPQIGNLAYSGNGVYDLGPKKIQGNLTLESNAELILHGPIHVTGNFTMNSNTQLKIDNSFGSTGTIVVVDGTVSLNSNAKVHSTSANPKGYILIATTRVSPTDGITVTSNGNVGILYALDSNIQLNSNAKLVALVANRLTMESNAVLNYDQGLAQASFSTGPGGSWQIKRGTYKFFNIP